MKTHHHQHHENGERSPQARRTTRRSAPKRISVGVDNHSGGRDAAVLGGVLARALGADLMLIAVYEEPLLEVALPAEVGWKSVRKQAQSMLAETRDSLAPGARIVVQSDVLAWRGLEHVVRVEKRDLLVVGSGQQAADGHVGLGDTTAELPGHLASPVAIAPRGMRDRTNTRLARIGIGFDDTPESAAALELASSIAFAAGADLHVGAVVDNRVPGGLRTQEITLSGDTIVAKEMASLAARTESRVSATGVPARMETSSGNPADLLCELGTRVDLLVIGSGRSGHDGRIAFGDTGSALAGAAPCPLLVVPRPD